MEGVKNTLSEELKKCWRCGFKIPNGSICPMCCAVNKLVAHESIRKELLDGGSEEDNKRKRFLNAIQANDNKGEAFSLPDTMGSGKVEGAIEEKRVLILSTETHVDLPVSVTLPEAQNEALKGDMPVDQQPPLLTGPGCTSKRVAAITTHDPPRESQMNPTWIN